MDNYRFDSKVAKKMSLRNLFVILIGLIEVKRRVVLYRDNATTQLSQFGICNNLIEVTKNSEASWLSPLFFKNCVYPILPYFYSGYSRFEQIKARWGNNPIGNQRIAMLDLMIKDLTSYLTKRA